MTSATGASCPLCKGSAFDYHRGRRRNYLACSRCGLVFVPAEFFVSADQEKARYELHQNSPDDAGYRKFLSRICDPLIQRLPVGCRGLDFGCGPGPTLAVLFQELGYPVALYDPFFATDESVLEEQYDFVTATEVVEHLREPARSLEEMWRCVKPGGYLGLMTKLITEQTQFGSWHYKNDFTHICFYSRGTFEWLASRWGTTPVIEGGDVILFHKPLDQS